MRSLWLLHELGVPFDVRTYAFDKTLRKPEFLAKSPAGRVPALEIDGQVLFETGAITQVLCERFPEAGMGRATDDPERCDWLVWVETISNHTANLTQQHIAIYDDAMRSPTVMKLEAARLGKCFAAVDARLEGRDYLLDSGFSAADVSVGQAVYMAQHFVELNRYENLKVWFTAMAKRDAFRKSLPGDGEGCLYTKAFYPPWTGDAQEPAK